MHRDKTRYLPALIAIILIFQTGSAVGTETENAQIIPLPAEEATGSGSLVVTSVEGCLKKLPPDSAEEIRLHFDKPYQECQQRLRQQEQKQRSAKTGENGQTDGQGAPVAEGPRNFLRVQNKTRETGFSPQKPQGEKAAVPDKETAAAAPPAPAPAPPSGRKPALNSSAYNH